MTDCPWCLRGPRNEGCCVLCPTFGTRTRHVEQPAGCPDCRLKLRAIPADIGDAYPLLADILEPQRGKTDTRSRRADASIPLAVDPYDLTANHITPQGPIGRARLAANLDLQIGHLPVAAVLSTWIRDWAELRDVGENYTGTVYAMCRWLTERTDWAVDHHPAVDEYAAELADLRGVLLALVGRTEPDERPQRLPGVPCVRCRHVTLLRRHDGTVECSWPDCRTVWRADEYDHLTKAAAYAARRVVAMQP